MKQYIDAFAHAGTVCDALKKGNVLLTTKLDGKVNTMTIGWGKIDVEWGKPIFIAYVRKTRHTHAMLERNGEFTVNIPLDAVDKKILGYCGTKSGRDTDKIADLGLVLETPEVISVPGIRQLPLTLECKVIYKQTQDMAAIPADLVQKYYPQGVADPDQGRNRDIHVAYYGEIVASYIIEDA